MVIVSPAIRALYRKLIQQVNTELGKQIIAYMAPSEEKCPNCFWDEINKKSSGKFDAGFVAPVVIFGETINPTVFTRGRCPICRGAGKLTFAVTRNVRALVRWNPQGADDLVATPVGREGAPTVRIKVLRSKFETIRDAVYFMVDGVRCELIQPPTIRGLGTQEEQVVAYLLATEVGSDVKA